MKRTKLFIAVALLALCASPVFAANKDMVQLQTQVQAIQDQLTQMKQSFDERMGVMRNLVEQSTDTMNKLNGTMSDLQKSLAQQHNDSGTRADQLSGQIQVLNDSVDELKARLNKMSQQLDAMQAAAQNLNTAPAGTTGAPGSRVQLARPVKAAFHKPQRLRQTCSTTTPCATTTPPTISLPCRNLAIT